MALARAHMMRSAWQAFLLGTIIAFAWRIRQLGAKSAEAEGDIAMIHRVMSWQSWAAPDAG